MSVHFHSHSRLYIVCMVATAKCMLNVESKVYCFMNKLCGDWESTVKEKLLLHEVEERVDTAGDSEEDESISVGDSGEEETDPQVQEEVGEIVNTFSTVAVCNES